MDVGHPADARAQLARGLPMGQQICRIFDVDGLGLQWFVGVVQGHEFDDSSGQLSLNVVVGYEDGEVEKLPVRSAACRVCMRYCGPHFLFRFAFAESLPFRLPQRESALGGLRDFLESNHIRLDASNEVALEGQRADGDPQEASAPRAEATAVRETASSCCNPAELAEFLPTTGAPSFHPATCTTGEEDDDLPRPAPTGDAACRADDAAALCAGPAPAADEPSLKGQRLLPMRWSTVQPRSVHLRQPLLRADRSGSSSHGTGKEAPSEGAIMRGTGSGGDGFADGSAAVPAAAAAFGRGDRPERIGARFVDAVAQAMAHPQAGWFQARSGRLHRLPADSSLLPLSPPGPSMDDSSLLRPNPTCHTPVTSRHVTVTPLAPRANSSFPQKTPPFLPSPSNPPPPLRSSVAQHHDRCL